MGQTDVSTDFLELLAKSELLSQETVAQALSRFNLGDEASDRDVAKAFVSDGLLTRFQANRLLHGRSHGYWIDQYKLLEVLGEGGMGRLYLAEDGKTGRKAAVKVLSDRYQHDAGMITRMKLEALAGQRLNHPNIVGMIEFAQSRDVFERYYLVMEFVPGIGLQELLAVQGRRPWQQACDFVRQAAEALQHAHDHGLVHRDIKPGNLLVLPDGHTKVLDFGLALVEDEQEHEFSLSMIFGHDCLGSADYMAPEQAVDSHKVDGRADIYSLGCTLYSTITGAYPFTGSSAKETIRAHRTEQAKPVSQRVGDVPDEVEAIVRKMMAKQPEERYQKAQEVVTALEPYSKRTPVDFDFRELLLAREKQAKQRARRQQPKHRSRTGSTLASATASTAAESTSAAERSLSWVGDEPSTPSTVGGRAAGGSSVVGREAGSTTRPRTASAAQQDLKQPPHDEAGRRPPSGRGPMLVPMDGGRPILLDQDEIVVGRKEDCNVQLERPGISGRHFRLRADSGAWHLTDLDSKNGVRVNGVTVKQHMLVPGDRITVAERYHFLFQVGNEKPKATKAAFLAAAAIGVIVLGGLLWWLLT